MKKILITLFAVALGVSAFGKTLAELQAELPKPASDPVVRKARLAYFEANKADFQREFDSWKNTARAKVTNRDLPKLPQAELEAERAVRQTLAGFYIVYRKELECSDLVAFNLGCQFFFMHNKGKYDECKNNGWKLDGVEISNEAKFIVACDLGDADYVLANSAMLEKLDKWFLSNAVNGVKKIMLTASDIEKAKAFCNAYERAMLLKNCETGTDTIKAVGKYLTERLLDAKISK